MVLAEQWQCSLYADVLSVQSSVPTMFLPFLANGRVTNGRVPPLPILFKQQDRGLKTVGDVSDTFFGSSSVFCVLFVSN